MIVRIIARCTLHVALTIMGVILGSNISFYRWLCILAVSICHSKKVKAWSWESYWIVGGLFSWLIVPPIAAWLTLPGFIRYHSQHLVANNSIHLLFGLLWGIGGLTYGLGVRYLGMSLGNSVVLGFCSAFGALVPSIYYSIVPTEGKTSFHRDDLNNLGTHCFGGCCYLSPGNLYLRVAPVS